ncbi:uncharacterized protein LOC115736762 isoform X2 [Rhodamnia argentea]|uniref:Uncharacterized protein LOC115736762 isoform X2 n=1 Tax=Rhodamnia argentea TaxID=178133 RepID=A0A8B8NPM0_9MYRT|nr:uncharacterized protein LOC115736762 isoform X2 [Rhodamnia argentea]
MEVLSSLYWYLPKHEDEDHFSYEEHDGAHCCVMVEEDIEAEFAKITEISSFSGDGEEEEGEVLLLKLNYEEVLSAWSEHGPLYTDDDHYLLPMAATSGCYYMVEEKREGKLA